MSGFREAKLVALKAKTPPTNYAHFLLRWSMVERCRDFCKGGM